MAGTVLATRAPSLPKTQAEPCIFIPSLAEHGEVTSGCRRIGVCALEQVALIAFQSAKRLLNFVTTDNFQQAAAWVVQDTKAPHQSAVAASTGGYPAGVPGEFYSIEVSWQSTNEYNLCGVLAADNFSTAPSTPDCPAGAIAGTSPPASKELESAATPFVSRTPVTKSLCRNTGFNVLQKSKLVEEFVVQEFGKNPVLYDGLASTVVVGQRKKDKLDVCIKIIEKDKCADKAELQRARAELDIHKDIPHHRNVVLSLASEETADAFLLITPFTAAGDLWDKIKHGQTICEIETRNCLAQVLEALCHIHGLGLIHGDMKPHNILLFKVEGRFAVQLCDFGLAERATLADGKIPFTGLRGTSGWYAPEQIDEVDYNSAVDVWGVGLMAFRMLVGYEPFYPANCFCEPVDFDESYFSHISWPCLNLIQQLLKLNPQQRATASTAAKHIWFTGDPPPEPTQEMLQNLERYGSPPAKDLCFFAPNELAMRN